MKAKLNASICVCLLLLYSINANSITSINSKITSIITDVKHTLFYLSKHSKIAIHSIGVGTTQNRLTKTAKCILTGNPICFFLASKNENIFKTISNPSISNLPYTSSTIYSSQSACYIFCWRFNLQSAIKFDLTPKVSPAYICYNLTTQNP